MRVPHPGRNEVWMGLPLPTTLPLFEGGPLTYRAEVVSECHYDNLSISEHIWGRHASVVPPPFFTQISA